VILVPDERDIVINLNTVQPLSEKSKSVMWSCGRTCVVQQESIDKLMGFIQMMVAASEKQQYVIFQNIDVCNNKVRQSTLMGHSLTCIENNDCPSTLRTLRELSVHYNSSIRNIVRDIYPIKSHKSAINLLDKAMQSGNEEQLDSVIQMLKNLLQKQSS